MKTPWGAVALAVVVSAGVFAHAFKTRSRANHQVSVVGSGSKDFESDLVSWTAHFTRKNLELKSAYNALNEDRGLVTRFLTEHGANEKELIFSSIAIDKEFDSQVLKDGTRTQQFTGYRLTQSVQVESAEVDKYERISRDITELINAGLELTSGSPEYFFTKLPALKIEMVAAAARDAHERAEKIVENAGGHLGKLRQASMGVFQITAQHSSEEFSWRGTYNTNSRRKTATVTMRLEYESD